MVRGRIKVESHKNLIYGLAKENQTNTIDLILKILHN